MPRGIHKQASAVMTAPLTATRDKPTAPSLPIAEVIRAFNDSQDAEGYTQATQISYYKVLVVLARYLKSGASTS